MRITYIANSIIPSRTANSIHVMKMCQAFAKQGHEVLLIAPDRRGIEINIAGDDEYKFYGVDECFEITKHQLLPIKGGKMLYNLTFAIKARLFNSDLVYGRYLPGCYYSALLGLPVFYESHMPLYGKNEGKIFIELLKKKSFRYLVVISKALSQHYQDKYSIDEEKIIIAPDAADYPKSSYQNIEIGKENLKVGYVGHLYPGKGMEIIVELAKRCSWADFHVVGGLEEDIKRWKNQLNSIDNLTMHGFVAHGLVESYLHSFDVLLAPYQEQVFCYGGSSTDIGKWMSPLKLFEYMAVGKPIVCSDLPVLREIIRDGENAILCPPGDMDCWVDALFCLSRDASYAKNLGDKARKDFLKHYTWMARAKKLLGVI